MTLSYNNSSPHSVEVTSASKTDYQMLKIGHDTTTLILISKTIRLMLTSLHRSRG